jgi:hypothetical protein
MVFCANVGGDTPIDATEPAANAAANSAKVPDFQRCMCLPPFAARMSPAHRLWLLLQSCATGL